MYLEVKRNLDKPDAVYACDLLFRGADTVVLKYVSDGPGQVGEVHFEAGSTTFAYYRDGAGYVLWKMCVPQGGPKGHLFHICRDLRVGEEQVEYLDLLLDLWFDGEGNMTVLDREQLEACRASGAIGGGDLAWIARQEDYVVRNATRIIKELDGLLEARTL